MYADEDLSKAPEAVKNGMNKKKAAKTFRIARTTIIDHASGRKGLEKKAGKPSSFPKQLRKRSLERSLVQRKRVLPSPRCCC